MTEALIPAETRRTTYFSCPGLRVMITRLRRSDEVCLSTGGCQIIAGPWTVKGIGHCRKWRTASQDRNALRGNLHRVR